MKSILVPNWKEILVKAWSPRLIGLAVILSGAEAALPLLDGYLPIRQGIFAGLSGLIGSAAFYARFVVQKGLSDGKPSEE